MNNKIAIEGGLSNVTQELQDSNYDLVNLEESNLENVEAVILNGEDNNMMNMSDIKTEAQVINAQGLSASEVKSELQNRLV
ncbi:YkuS family protein [Halanaerobaculum tunisiense]